MALGSDCLESHSVQMFPDTKDNFNLPCASTSAFENDRYNSVSRRCEKPTESRCRTPGAWPDLQTACHAQPARAWRVLAELRMGASDLAGSCPGTIQDIKPTKSMCQNAHFSIVYKDEKEAGVESMG